ncbi:MAG: 5'/3'-nucleotidase SurE [Oscillatoria sp. PMC 1051.18]|uniref:5'/3'-nucleotidase SurE n=1 Tax=Oscillatoria salina TaxID=331517 RepID=UPI0013BDD59F|nr:5'/3'-nucleotidase SurE [Oscillatoria salina]MBZ8180225.1 5'/3'-nucleotidase SurE [Oscillatoria salina IIICB1]MEC4891577.1 5'/3'-nucleotidase SurE [Oscillatoria sp. PMC 1050.18]MEC5029639.1 5'/3'-nucleotidase SurE [Oscillatoria sp. PMC 1051.18]NET89529.1 5'/3'-nucleotidase SurE [Kamptonema sp. SIO1D9]
MKLLISNDDGFLAKGIRTLANTLAQAGHEVTVVCPDRERSATGHGLTLHQPIRAEIVESIFDSRVTAWSCSGTPSDCVKFALSAVCDPRPDFVLSGINHGSNLGTDVLYSGTVSAAMEGVIEGIPSIAISLASFTYPEFSVAANFARQLLDQLSKQPLEEVTLLNVNVPPVKQTEIAGVAITRQGLRRYIESFEKRVDPRGKSYYWLAGEVVEDITQPDHLHLPAEMLTDVQAIRENYITITPLQYNLTDVGTVESLLARQSPEPGFSKGCIWSSAKSWQDRKNQQNKPS